MALVKQGFNTLQDILYGGKQKLMDVLKNSLRVEALLQGAAAMAGHNPRQMHDAHLRVAQKLGVLAIVQDCYEHNGVEYENAILRLLHMCGLKSIKSVDNGIRQNVPDLLLKVGNQEAFIECKTATKSPALINKEDAWAVLQKAADFGTEVRRITLGKPGFDETSMKKAAATSELTLVEHGVLIEALLRMKAGGTSAEQFMDWLCAPGVAEIERLPGDPSYSL